ncbi:hypothetical protein [Methylobacterium brachythecii]|uniref:Opacity protein-like surface antigen n=1 Tax=Methylobacterium brachythecii TaxID=1176177 RepID=A0A7W6AJG3_9HYPH|nr:hypothetical protein [Methylobacterium brachythecii]MBB3904512.1 opacity protein-like surface antigen [Methylobacterium brachythecii]
MRSLLLTVMLAVALQSSAALAAAPPCATDAGKQALKLLRFHSDGDDRATIDAAGIKQIGTVASLVGNRRFDVIEVEGSIYKGEYRMRLIYARMSGSCVLMGQEIFERSDPY